jgi:hypothetical protein
MPKTKISEYSATNSSNTDIEGINIDEGCPPSSINNAIRELMVHLKEFQTGASGDAFTFAGGTLMSGTNTISGAAVISGNINSSGTANTFSGGVVHSGTNTFSSSVIISGNINSSGTTNTFSGGNVLSGTNTFSGTNVFSSDVTLNAQSDLRFADSDSSNWVAFQSPATVASNVTWTLPATDGTSNQALVTNGSGTLSWATAGGGASISAGDSKVEVTDTGSNGTIVLNTENAERMRIDSSGRMLVGTTTARGVAAAGSAVFEIEAVNAIAASLVNNNNSSGSSALLMFGKSRGGAVGGTTVVQNGDELGEIRFAGADGTNLQSFAASIRVEVDGTPGSGDMPGRLIFSTTADGAGSSTERARFTSGGEACFGTTATILRTQSGGSGGVVLNAGGLGISDFARSSSTVIAVNLLSVDGTLIDFRQDGTAEGTISVSGTTVSYNGGHLSRWAQMPGTKDDTLLKGTVMSNLDEMNVYTDAEGNPVDNEQLNKVKVSDVEGDVNVAGVFVNWAYDEAHQVDEINMAMTGDMIIRIAQGVVVQKGDLLVSAGDGTAKPQDDDIVRSKTVAKVTSNHVTCTYADGSYCVPCVLMAC